MKQLEQIATGDVIDALKAAAEHIREDLDKRFYGADQEPLNYIWADPDRCICGQFVSHLLGEDIEGFPFAWCNLFQSDEEAVCTKSGLTCDQIRESLAEHGFNDQMISHLENANQPAVLEEMGVKSIEVGSPAHVSEYLEAMAALLEELRKEKNKTTHRKELAPA
jgi:hypothetical protein